MKWITSKENEKIIYELINGNNIVLSVIDLSNLYNNPTYKSEFIMNNKEVYKIDLTSNNIEKAKKEAKAKYIELLTKDIEVLAEDLIGKRKELNKLYEIDDNE